MAVDQENFPSPGRRPLRGKITVLPPLTFGPAWPSDTGPRDSRSFLNPVNPKRARNCPRHPPFARPKKSKKSGGDLGLLGPSLAMRSVAGVLRVRRSPAVDRQAGWLVSAGWGWGAFLSLE